MLAPELQAVLTIIGTRLRSTKFKSVSQMLEMKESLGALMNPMIEETVKKKTIANRQKAKDKAEKQAYRDQFREKWVKASLPVGATVKTVSARSAYIVLAVKEHTVVVSDPKRSVTTEVMHKNVHKVLSAEGKMLDIYTIAAQSEQPSLKITEVTFG